MPRTHADLSISTSNENHWFSFVLIVVLTAVFLFLLGCFVVVMSCDYESYEGIGSLFGLSEPEEKNALLTFLGISMGGVLLAFQAVIADRRAQAMEKTAKAQAEGAKAQAKANSNTEQGQRQERLRNAIEHLGNEATSVRMGGAYELFHLAEDTKEWRQRILDILCAHIRQTTREAEYREKHRSSPSEEIQSLLGLLFVQDHTLFEDCLINLRGSWLNGTNLTQSRLRCADLREVQLQGALLLLAQLQGANFVWAQLQGTNLAMAQLQGTILGRAQLQGAILGEAQLQGADLGKAQLQGVQGFKVVGIGFDFSFTEHIRKYIGVESDFSGVVFAGGLTQDDLDSSVRGLPDGIAKGLREKLKPHVGQPGSHELPKDSGAVIGSYTAEEAEEWIADYEAREGC